MDYSLCILSVIVFIEKRVRDDMDLRLLTRDTGFSYRHLLREVFRECTRMTLAKYALSRRVAHAAFDIMHTGKSLMEIAGEYGFDTYDTFSRAFRRETGIVPSLFRKTNITVGRKRLAAGAYGPAVLPGGIGMPASKLPEVGKMTKETEKSADSCILYGVPKVEYKYDECTPFPSCLKACLNYMGQQADYSSLMAASGAAFRLRWNVNRWDGGNVDIQYVYEDPLEAFRRSFQAVGRKVSILSRKGASKEQFMAFIREEIDHGRPVIALGIIGPPEACILTGYADKGETLLGWNFFQGNPEFDRERETHECGYFISHKWWENECTSLLMAIGEEAGKPDSIRDLLENAVNVLTKERIVISDPDSSEKRIYAGGQAAFDAWAEAIANDMEFPENAILPLLFERTMCQTDAQTMVGEGRSHASCWLHKIGDRYPEISDLCLKAAQQFRDAAECTLEMHKIKGGFEQNEQNIRTLAKPEIRRQIVTLIQKAKYHDHAACGYIQDMLESLS